MRPNVNNPFLLCYSLPFLVAGIHAIPVSLCLFQFCLAEWNFAKTCSLLMHALRLFKSAVSPDRYISECGVSLPSPFPVCPCARAVVERDPPSIPISSGTLLTRPRASCCMLSARFACLILPTIKLLITTPPRKRET